MRKLVFSITKDDCQWQNFTVGGHGGSGKDTSNTGVRCIHAPSGARGEGRNERSQLANKRAAFKRMAQSKEFQLWARLKASSVDTRSVDEIIDEQMQEQNLLVEVF